MTVRSSKPSEALPAPGWSSTSSRRSARRRSLALRRPTAPIPLEHPWRSQRRALVVLSTQLGSDRPAQALTERLGELGITALYLGRQDSATLIAEAVARERAHAVELLLPPTGGVSLLRDLLRELIRVGRRDVSIVVHSV